MLARVVFSAVVSVCLLFPVTGARADAIIADHDAVAEFGLIPPETIEIVKNAYRLFYGHTSHGSQIVTGMEMLRDENILYDFNNGPGTLYLEERSGDLGHHGDTTWVRTTRERLNEPGCDINVVMWSWCGGCSDNTEEGINVYLNATDALEQHYPDVMFVYMTGHLDGTGPEGNLYARNNQIRNYCGQNGKVLFDFADIESYDPGGSWYPWGSDQCEWCYEWCSSHPCPGCSGCAHSHCFNCYLKGKGFWWMMCARASGWSSGVDGGPGEDVGRGRLPVLEQNYPNPFNPVTHISFSLPEPFDVKLEIYGMAGQKVATLLDAHVGAGRHSVRWLGDDDEGRPVASGTYFYKLSVGGTTEMKRMIMLK